jgi:tripartite-type tricarboxylate transporter receptor subunit TctC
MKRLIGILAACLFAAGPAAAAGTDDYPSRPIHIVVPTVPGGATDFIARYIGQKLSQTLGRAVIVDNRAGADGNIGVDYVAKAAPDGYTLLIPITSFPTNPSLYKKLPFNTVKDFESIALLSKAPLLLTINPSVPAKSVQELVAYAKAHPGKLNYAHSGSGTTSHLAGELFHKLAGINIVPIGYKGGGQIITDLIAGNDQIYFATIPAALQHVKAGKLRMLAVTGSSRVPGLPDVPTMQEAGVPGFDVQGWFGLYAPAGTPEPIIDKLNAAVVKILALPETQQAFGREGLTAGSGTPQDLHQYLVNDIAKWKKLITDAGIAAQ